MISDNNKKLAQWALDYALKKGCQAARVKIFSGSKYDVEVRNMQIDKLLQASENSMVLHLFVDGRYGSFSTNRMDKKELEKFISNGIDSSRYLAEDKARTLPDKSLYYNGNEDLQLYDSKFHSIGTDKKIELAMQVCAEMMNKDERIISATGSYDDREYFSYQLSSNGFEGETASTSFGLNSSVSIKGDGDERPESWWYDSALFFDDLIKEGIGTKSFERVMQKLGQKKTKSGKYSMLVDSMVLGNVIRPIISALYGSSIQQKNSFLLNKLNEKVLGENITLIDDPHQPKTSGARFFDDEGIATKKQPIFENGVLKTYFIDTYYGNKLETAPTIDSPSILTMQLGNKNIDQLIETIEKGIYVTGFNGGNSNSSTGDFSFGIEGFLIEQGKRVQPVNEMNITGNLLTLWNNLKEVGNDPFKPSRWKIPSLLFEGVDFSGL
ncbi:MAG: TldD/PmbA family protein [Marinilabiliaceae bacterium]|nr:TldD/PmbA family protein [Marinilabiliaceae bacterium]